MKVTEISKLLGEQWKSMDTAARVPYEEKAAADKERYAALVKSCECPSFKLFSTLDFAY